MWKTHLVGDIKDRIVAFLEEINLYLKEITDPHACLLQLPQYKKMEVTYVT